MRSSRLISILAAAAALAAVPLGPVHPAGDLSRQEPITITVELGKPGQHAFVPNKLRFETGKLYKLVLKNLEQRPALFHLARLHPAHLHAQGPGRAGARRQARPRSPSSRAPSARSRSIPGRSPNGGSCRWRPGASPTCVAASSTRTARPMPITAWWARSSSSDRTRRVPSDFSRRGNFACIGHPVASQCRLG